MSYNTNLKRALSVLLAAVLVIAGSFALAPTGRADAAGTQPAAESAPYTTSGARDYFADVYPSLGKGSVFETATYKRVIDILTPARTVSYPDKFGDPATPHQVGGGSNDNSGSAKDGSVVFLLGGAENGSTQATIATINSVAKEYGVDKIYNFDPKLDGGLFGGDLDITVTTSAVPSAYRNLWTTVKNRIPNIPAEYTSDSTYLVVVTRAEGGASITTKGLLINDEVFNEAGLAKLAADVAEVFSVIPGAAQKNAQELAPTNFEFFKSVVNGNNYDQAAHGANPRPRDYGDVLKDEDNADGFRIVAVTYPELVNILEHEGNYEIYFSGLWCPYSRPSFKYINKAAQDNDIDVVYQFDFRLDSRGTNVHIRDSNNEYSYLYGKLLDTYLTNFDNGSWNATTQKWDDAILYYPGHDKSIGSAARPGVPRIGVPTLIEYDRDRKDGQGKSAPLYVGQIGFESWDYVNGGPDIDEPGETPPYVAGEHRHYESALEVIQVYQQIANNIHDRRASLYPWSEPYYGIEENHAGNDEPVADGDCGTDGDEDAADLTPKPFPQKSAGYGYDISKYYLDATYAPLEKGSERYTVGALENVVATFSAAPSGSLDELQFNLGSRYQINAVKLNGASVPFTRSGSRVTAKPASPIDEDFVAEVSYDSGGESAQGFIASLNSAGATADFSAGWYPRNPNDKARFDITVTTRSDLAGVANGKLASTVVKGALTTRRWVQNDETNPESFILSIGDYKQVQTSATLKSGKTIPVSLFIDKSIYNSSQANKAILDSYAAKIPAIIAWGENRLGAFPYSSLNAVFEKQARAPEDEVYYSFSLEGLVVYNAIERETTIAHELIHQWFGVNIEQPDDSQTWLSEGWATFFANVYLEDTGGSGQTTTDWYRAWFAANYDTNFWSVPPGDIKNPGNTSYTYGRGAYALAALRASLSDADFFKLIGAWVEEKAGETVNTEQFLVTAERVADVDLSSYAAAWIYGGTRPSSFPNAVLPKKTVDNGNGDEDDDGGNPPGTDKDTSGKNDKDKDASDKDKSLDVLRSDIAAALVTIKKSSAYTGRPITPPLTVKLGGKALASGKDYTVAWKNNRAIGKASATVTGIGSYKGSKEVDFTVIPKTTKGLKAKAGKKSIKVTWKKNPGITKYRIAYRAKGASKWTIKTAGGKAVSLKLGKLRKGKAYQLRISAYKTVGGVKYESGWSKAIGSKKVK
jgi:hypothetical protein